MTNAEKIEIITTTLYGWSWTKGSPGWKTMTEKHKDFYRGRAQICLENGYEPGVRHAQKHRDSDSDSSSEKDLAS
jgi:hypothetical protein